MARCHTPELMEVSMEKSSILVPGGFAIAMFDYEGKPYNGVSSHFPEASLSTIGQAAHARVSQIPQV